MGKIPEASLGISFFQQGAPELPGCGGAAEEQHSIPADRQTVVHDHVQPAAEPPEAEVEDPGVQVRMLRAPLLICVVGDHLGDGETETRKKVRDQHGGRVEGREEGHLLPQ